MSRPGTTPQAKKCCLWYAGCVIQMGLCSCWIKHSATSALLCSPGTAPMASCPAYLMQSKLCACDLILMCPRRCVQLHVLLLLLVINSSQCYCFLCYQQEGMPTLPQLSAAASGSLLSSPKGTAFLWVSVDTERADITRCLV